MKSIVGNYFNKPSDGLKLKAASVFWKNDLKDGFGFILVNHDGRLEGTLTSTFKTYDENYQDEANQADCLNALRKQLDQFSKYKNHPEKNLLLQSLQPGATEYPSSFMILMFANVWLIESYGGLIVDEYNGCQFDWSS